MPQAPAAGVSPFKSGDSFQEAGSERRASLKRADADLAPVGAKAVTGRRVGLKCFRAQKGVPDNLPCVLSVSVSLSSKVFPAVPGCPPLTAGGRPPPPSRPLRFSGCPDILAKGFLIGWAGSRGSPRPIPRLLAE